MVLLYRYNDTIVFMARVIAYRLCSLNSPYLLLHIVDHKNSIDNVSGFIQYLVRVRLLLSKGHSCYRPRRTGERKRKSVRGCIVDANMSVIALTVVKKGEKVSLLS